MPRTSPITKQGFTLLEVVVATTIATVVLAAATFAWLQAGRALVGVERHGTIHQGLRVAHARLADDLTHALAPPVVQPSLLTLQRRNSAGMPVACRWHMTETGLERQVEGQGTLSWPAADLAVSFRTARQGVAVAWRMDGRDDPLTLHYHLLADGMPR